MGKQASNTVRLWIDEFALAGFINAFSLDLEQQRAVVTTLSDTGPARVVGNYDHSIDWSGFFDGDDGSFDENVFVDLKTDENHFASVAFTNSEGALSYQDVLRLTSQPRGGQVGGAVTLNLQAEGSGTRTRGVVLANATVTGAGQRTGRNMGATASDTLFAVHFHLVTFNGTNITLKVQESQNDGSPDTYTDVSGLTSGALTAAGVVRATTTAATESWKRVDISGTFTSAVIVVTAGS